MRWFLSYNSRDLESLLLLKAALADRSAGDVVFFDKESLVPGHYWIPRLAKEIADADVFVLLLGQNGVGPWQQLEYQEALDRYTKDSSFLVILFVLPDARVPGLHFQDQFHWVIADHPSSPRAIGHLIDAAKRRRSQQDERSLWRFVTPYRGLPALEETDGEYFFGRDEETRETIRRLADAPNRIPVLVGNSGVGKSSVAMAGVIGALKRQRFPSEADPWPDALGDSRKWCYLRISPGTDAVAALVGAFWDLWDADATDHEEVKQKNGWIEDLRVGALGLDDLVDTTTKRILQRGGPPPPAFLLYVDQGEEIYAQSGRRTGISRKGRADREEVKDERHIRFTKLLADGVQDPRLRVFMSLRADFYGALLDDEALRDLRDTIDIEPLDRDMLETVITGPADALRVRFADDSLPSKLVAQADRAAGSMPLLSYLLDDMWSDMRRRDDGLLQTPIKAIDLGGVLGRRGDEFLAQSDVDEVVVRRLFTLKLVHLEEGGEPLRRRCPLATLDEEERAIVDILAKAKYRLLVTTGWASDRPDAGHVEVAHEAVLRDWPTLRSWLTGDEGRQKLLEWLRRTRRLLKLNEKAIAAGKGTALLTGYVLDEARTKLREWSDDIPAPERVFVEESIRAEARRQQEETEREERQRRAELEAARSAQHAAEESARADSDRAVAARRFANLMRLGLITMSVLVLAVAGVGYHAFRAEQDAERNAYRAAEEEQAARERLRHARITQSRFLAALSRRERGRGYLGDALALARETMPLGREDWPIQPEAVRALASAAIDYASALYRPTVGFVGHQGAVAGAAFTADESRILTWSPDGMARLWDVDTGTGIFSMDHGAPVRGATFNATESRLLTWSGDRTVRLWDAEVGAEIHNAMRHEREVSGAVFSADERQVLSWSADRTARLWDIETGAEIHTLSHLGEVLGAVFDREDRHVLSWSSDGTARLWDVETGEVIHTMDHHGDVLGALFSTQARRVLSWSSDGTARLWDVETGAELLTMRHEDDVLGAVFSADESSVLSWSTDNTVRLWDAETGAEIHTMRHEGDVSGAVLSSDERLVLTWSGDETAGLWAAETTDNTARLWDAKTGAHIHTMRHEGELIGAVFSADESRILTWSWDDTARLWDAETGAEVFAMRHENDVLGAAFDADETRILTWSQDGTVRLWDADAVPEVLVMSHEGNAQGAAFSANESRVLTWSWDDTVRLWDAVTGALVLTMRHEGDVSGAIFNANENHILTWSRDGTARVWDARTGAQIFSMRHQGDVAGAAFSRDESRILTWSRDGTAQLWDRRMGDQPITVMRHGGYTWGGAFSADESRIITWSWDGTARLWDALNGTEILVMRHEGDVSGTAFSADESRILTWSDDDTARLWHVETGAEILVMRHEGNVSGARFSADESRILTWSWDGTARLWNAETGATIHTLRQSSWVVGAAFNADESRILTWSSDGTVRLWDAQTGSEILVMRHEYGVRGAAFSDDGTRVLTWSSDSTARLWDTGTGDEIVAMRHQRDVRGAAFGADESRILTWSRDGTVRLWPNWRSIEELETHATSIVNRLRPLSGAERCQAYLDVDGCVTLW